jgi:hypothetical protein
MLSVEMNTRLWMLFTSLLAVASAGSVTGQSSSPPSSPASKSWFREKYLVGAYDTYYEYTLHRFELRDNDRDMCPDVYKSATIFAVTGQYMNRIKQTCSIAVYVQRNTDIHAHYPPPEAPDLRFIHITVMDILHFVGQLVCYTFEYVMLVISIILASCSTLFMIILLFYQY